ncbi:hypothetical protein F0562_003479 [Nyssa sinensis]|uniref:Uncharacterized protein n=1 Tax=Nyssa sinensis TaxID=561372 RepID=A0A5J5BYN7_9ASTE|nr:hypothetical protein F0562_003479 [Nyssa sinensis]
MAPTAVQRSGLNTGPHAQEEVTPPFVDSTRSTTLPHKGLVPPSQVKSSSPASSHIPKGVNMPTTTVPPHGAFERFPTPQEFLTDEVLQETRAQHSPHQFCRISVVVEDGSF